MRIIAGTCKGHPLKAPAWDGLRPTSDRLRETLFNILAPRVDGAHVLDVFAGTGAVGLEALSRGASRAVFIDQDRRAAALIAENARRAGLADRCVIIRLAADRALDTTPFDNPFDIIVLDPPYAWRPSRPGAGVPGVMDRALEHLAPGGVLVLEHAWRQSPPAVDGGTLTRTVKSGDSAVSFYEPDLPAPESRP